MLNILNTVIYFIIFVFYIHIFRFFMIIFIFLHGSTFLSILDAIFDFPGNNKKHVVWPMLFSLIFADV